MTMERYSGFRDCELVRQSIPLWPEVRFSPANIVGDHCIRRPQGDDYRQLISSDPKKSASRLKEADSTKLVGKSGRFLVEKVPDAGANQMLPQIATLVRVDLGTCIVEVVVFDKRAPVRIEKVI